MNTHAKLDLPALEQLRTVSDQMHTFAQRGDWKAVLTTDKKRLQILQHQNSSLNENCTQPSHQTLIDEILNLDEKIKELAVIERKNLMNREIRQQAQVAAQSGYQKVLSSDSGS